MEREHFYIIEKIPTANYQQKYPTAKKSSWLLLVGEPLQKL